MPIARITAPVLSATLSIFFRKEVFALLAAMILGIIVSSVIKISVLIVWLATISKMENVSHVRRTAVNAILRVSAWSVSMDYL